VHGMEDGSQMTYLLQQHVFNELILEYENAFLCISLKLLVSLFELYCGEYISSIK
jgi:hypothetical protein